MLSGMAATPVKVLIIPPDGPGEVRELPQDIRTLQGVVGGYIEAVKTMWDDDGNAQAILWCNEEGKLQNLPVNRRATALWYSLNRGPTGDTLCGTVIVSGPADANGDITPVLGELVDFWNDVNSPD